MQSPCIREISRACLQGCCPTPMLSLTEQPKVNTPTTTATSRSNFTSATTSSIYPNTQFSNHESLPSLPIALSSFTKAYPQFPETEQADHVRANEYYHLSISHQVCLDYIGFGLFSHSQYQTHIASAPSSSDFSSPHFSFFDISYKSVSLNSQLQYGTNESPLESAVRKRIMGFLNISENDYQMVYTANSASAFKLLAGSYPFQTNNRLLTVYDHENEALSGMIETSQKRGARATSASFSWPSLRINSTKLRKMVVGNRKKKKKGLFVFPLQSRMTGARYSYLWMSLAQENGWHVALDACALGSKDTDTLGLSLFKPDFLVCSFFKVFGEDPSGFGCLFVKRSSSSALEPSTMTKGIGIVSIVSSKRPGEEEGAPGGTNSFSGHVSDGQSTSLGSSGRQCEMGEVSASEIVELDKTMETKNPETNAIGIDESEKFECRGLDHADSLGLLMISIRVRFLVNWLVNALMKLRHPHSEEGLPLVRIYGPKIKFGRGPAVAFNVFDWKGEKVEPVLVQKLADRSNISLSCGFLQNIWFPDQYKEEEEKVLESKTQELAIVGSKRKEKVVIGLSVVTASISFLANFEDVYRLWAFVAKFLDADFVEKERWRYMALNQMTVEI